jgi:hypothetical protein
MRSRSNPEIRLNTSGDGPEANAHQIIEYLIDRGFLQSSDLY